MRFNFAKASKDQATHDARLLDVQRDIETLMKDGGVSRVAAESRWRSDAAALVREAVQDMFVMMDPTPIFFERRTGRNGDTYEFEQLINTLRVVEYSPGSDPQIFTPRKGKWTISTGSHELAYGIDLEKIMNGQHTVASFANMAAEALVRFYADYGLTAINTACATGVNDLKGRAVRTTAAGATVTKAEIDAAIRRMKTVGEGVTIFGSRYALDAIFDYGATAAGDQTKEELNRRGMIGAYRGCRLVELKDDYNPYYGWTKIGAVELEKLIFLSAGEPGAILLEKDLSQLNWEDLDQRTATWATGTRMEIGTLVHKPYNYHVVQLA